MSQAQGTMRCNTPGSSGSPSKAGRAGNREPLGLLAPGLSSSSHMRLSHGALRLRSNSRTSDATASSTSSSMLPSSALGFPTRLSCAALALLPPTLPFPRPPAACTEDAPAFATLPLFRDFNALAAADPSGKGFSALVAFASRACCDSCCFLFR